MPSCGYCNRSGDLAPLPAGVGPVCRASVCAWEWANSIRSRSSDAMRAPWFAILEAEADTWLRLCHLRHALYGTLHRELRYVDDRERKMIDALIGSVVGTDYRITAQGVEIALTELRAAGWDVDEPAGGEG